MCANPPRPRPLRRTRRRWTSHLRRRHGPPLSDSFLALLDAQCAMPTLLRTPRLRTSSVAKAHSTKSFPCRPPPTTMAVASLLFAGPLGPSYPSSFRIATLVPSPAESRRHSNADSFSSITLRDPTPSPRSPRIAGTPPSERPPSVFPTRKKKLAQVGEDGISSRAVPPMSVDTFLLEGRPRSIFPTRKAKKEARVLVRTG